jgi:hypothetical protein
MSTFSEVLANPKSRKAYKEMMKGGWETIEQKILIMIKEVEVRETKLGEIEELANDAEKTADELIEMISAVKSQIRLKRWNSKFLVQANELHTHFIPIPHQCYMIQR